MPRRRRGRPRKAGRRERSGRLERRQAETPRMVAAGMPHRRGLGERAVDQRAETELGRLVLRGVLDETLGLAGETYLSLWRGYVFSLCGPSELSNASGHGFTCDGCEGEVARRFCRCEFRRRIFCEAREKLEDFGDRRVAIVERVVLADQPVLAEEVAALQTGLLALAVHFGLTRRLAVVSQKISIDNSATPAP